MFLKPTCLQSRVYSKQNDVFWFRPCKVLILHVLFLLMGKAMMKPTTHSYWHPCVQSTELMVISKYSPLSPPSRQQSSKYGLIGVDCGCHIDSMQTRPKFNLHCLLGMNNIRLKEGGAIDKFPCSFQLRT